MRADVLAVSNSGMDAIRQIRFVYPPLVFASAVAIALRLDPKNHLKDITEALTSNGETAIVAFVLGSSALLACGYVIGSIPIFILRAGANMLGGRHYESLVESSLHETVWRRLGGPPGRMAEDEVAYLAAAFNHIVVNDRMYGWLERRWNAFNIAMHTGAALVMAYAVVHYNDVNPGSRWDWCVLGLSVMFFILAGYTWRDVRIMTGLLVRTTAPVQQGHVERSEGNK